MSNLNILVIRFRQKNVDDATWFFVVGPDDQPLTFLTSEAASEKANALTEQSGYQYEYVPNVLTASMSVAEFDGNKAQLARYMESDRVLRAQVEGLTNEATRYHEQHEQDIARIGEKLIEEANDRGWCRDYDKIVDDLNRHLHVELPVRMSDYDITYEVTIHVTRTCEGRDGDDAYQRDPGPSQQDVRDAVSNGGWDIGDWSVEASDG